MSKDAYESSLKTTSIWCISVWMKDNQLHVVRILNAVFAHTGPHQAEPRFSLS